jgi:hypothetical protein
MIMDRPGRFALSGSLRRLIASSAVYESGFRDAGLEQLDGIAGRILQQDLLAANPLNDVVAEMNPSVSEHLYPVGEVGDFNDESVPSAWFGLRAVWHRLAAGALTAWCAED